MQVYEVQEAFGLDHLKLTERPDPKPGRRQVVVAVKAASINYRDLMMVQGSYNPKLKLPFVPLSDGMGEVVAVGDAVTRAAVGDRVAVAFFEDWIARPVPPDRRLHRVARGGPVDGMLTKMAVVSEEAVTPAPSNLTNAEVATLPCAALTAWSALVSQGEVGPGQWVVVQGTGGVSLFALQFAKKLGARVIVTSSSEEKLARARSLGADHGINYKTTPDWGKAVAKHTTHGADHVLEVGGAGTLQQSLVAVRPGGHISVIGVLSGVKSDLNVVPILMNNIRLQGVHVGSRTEFEAMNRAIEQQNLKPVVDRIFPFEDAPRAFRYVEEAKHFGKVCISME
ncbi:MAG: NAD(P)-dependent alcohol dehydrogenase [Deltaproteobacteria bacterium]